MPPQGYNVFVMQDAASDVVGEIVYVVLAVKITLDGSCRHTMFARHKLFCLLWPREVVIVRAIALPRACGAALFQRVIAALPTPLSHGAAPPGYVDDADEDALVAEEEGGELFYWGAAPARQTAGCGRCVADVAPTIGQCRRERGELSTDVCVNVSAVCATKCRASTMLM